MVFLEFAYYLYLAKTFGTSAHGIRTLRGPLGHARFGVQVMPAFVICNRPLRSWLSSSTRIVNPVDARRISIFLALSLNCLAICILLPILLSWLRFELPYHLVAGRELLGCNAILYLTIMVAQGAKVIKHPH
jgi:hypothetical protein